MYRFGWKLKGFQVVFAKVMSISLLFRDTFLHVPRDRCEVSGPHVPPHHVTVILSRHTIRCCLITDPPVFFFLNPVEPFPYLTNLCLILRGRSL